MTRPLRTRLDNGLTVVVEEHAGAPVAAVQLWIRVGARDEAPGEAGLSHFIEHLLFKGTPTRGPGDIDRTISGVGGEMNAATSQDFTYYHAVLPVSHFPTALDVIADAAMRAVFDPDELDRERLVVLEEIRRSEDSPSASLWRALAGRHFAGHPYGRPILGTAESIRGVPRAQVVEYYRRHYVPGRAILVAAGAFDPAAALREADRVFGAWEARPVAASAAAPVGELTGTARVSVERPLRETHVALAWRGPLVPQTDVYAVELLVSVLGRGRSSRLHRALRERLGLVSSVGASFYTQRDAGTIMVTARTTAARRGEVEPAARAEIARLRDEPVTGEELARAVTAVEAGHAFGRETAEGAAYAYGEAETVWTLEFELGYVDAVRRVTRDEVREAARRYLAPDRFTVVTLGPER